MGERRECGWEMSSLERNTRGLKGFRLHSVSWSYCGFFSFLFQLKFY